MASQTVGRVEVQAVESAGGGLIAQPFQSGSDERAATVAVVEKTQLLFDRQAVAGDPPPQRRDLTGDGVFAGLAVRRDTGIHGNVKRCFKYSHMKFPQIVIQLPGPRAATPGRRSAVRKGRGGAPRAVLTRK